MASVTKSDFVRAGGSVAVSVGGVPQVCPARRFSKDKPASEQSVGWCYTGKVVLPRSALAGYLKVQVGDAVLSVPPYTYKDGKPGFQYSGKMSVGGYPTQVGINVKAVAESGDTLWMQAGVNLIVVKSKEWAEGEAVHAPAPAVAPAAPAAAPAETFVDVPGLGRCRLVSGPGGMTAVPVGGSAPVTVAAPKGKKAKAKAAAPAIAAAADPVPATATVFVPDDSSF